ncbi:Tim44-like domain-containing protein [Acinetobacter johnsonii]|uniref:Tim44-like domain-containing protein n=1 Tax=Acinetobacter johnsonii TaxID=40214 RepID=A0AA42U880_ACIJO|nr:MULTISPECIES: TIM44-like domain-containing protein [Acinetobacter]MBC6676666.1 Tim44 domain-containing protein [Acinetobacter sp.]MDH0654794.1 Tim44-like domain-containing protein [Acinetobacter johnsonii]MDH1364784.1 Tim44-like domain-containing protein [Acinetobacter johnsonii]MDH1439117.1 Tim44-like domain-containing protein [Acinetobacter johnsonii]WQN49800.1 TIM44-like domain-containing protein [Acinetobacter johnsonii]
MEVRQRGLIAGFLTAALLVAPLAAEAKRAGGGKSHGMSRQAAPTQSYQQPRQATPAQQPTAPATAPAKSGPGVGGMVAAGVAGAAIGAVAANALADDNSASQAQAQEEKGGIPSWIWILLAAAVAFFIFRKMGAKKKVAPNPYAPNNGSTQAPFGQQSAPRTSNDNSNIFGQSVGGSAAAPQNNAPFGAAYTNSGSQLPDGTEPAAFLRIARQRFNHIQSMNTASNISEIQRYLTPDLYQSMYQDIMANQDQDVAEFSNLNAMVADSATENGQYVVSVRFTGTVSEDLNSLPQPFAEVWHFVKPAGSTQDWLVAGIQQEA